jgi:hypothetical protein
MKTVLALAVSLLLVGCAETSLLRADKHKVGSDPYRVGPVTVLIRSQQEVQSICGVHLKVARDQRILGCFMGTSGDTSATIVSIPDPYAILHEFKHYFEGAFHD